MVAKFFLVACVAALFVNTIACPCGSVGIYDGLIGANLAGYGGCGGYGLGLGANVVSPLVAASSGGAFGVTSFSNYAPSGVQVVSNNQIEGLLEVVGALPYLSAVAFEGTVPSAGTAGTAYSCGSGNVGIAAESLAAAGLGAGAYNGFGAYNGLGAYGIGAANLGNAIVGAEVTGLNIGLNAGLNAGLTGVARGLGGCGCGIY